MSKKSTTGRPGLPPPLRIESLRYLDLLSYQLRYADYGCAGITLGPEDVKTVRSAVTVAQRVVSAYLAHRGPIGGRARVTPRQALAMIFGPARRGRDPEHMRWIWRAVRAKRGASVEDALKQFRRVGKFQSLDAAARYLRRLGEPDAPAGFRAARE